MPPSVHGTQRASTWSRSQTNTALLGGGVTGGLLHEYTAIDETLLWIRITEACLQHLVESVPLKIKTKTGPTQYKVQSTEQAEDSSQAFCEEGFIDFIHHGGPLFPAVSALSLDYCVSKTTEFGKRS